MQSPLSPRTKKRTYPFWAPRFWHSMRWGDWYRLMRRNRFRIHPLRWGLAATVSGFSCFNSVMAKISDARFREQLENASVPDNPIFIIGHWRSGTTYLHELLSCDPRFATPTTFQCFAANHFLVTERWMPKLIWFLMPSKRPMDNVPSGWQAPQEDEFALCARGVPSPYLRIAFPNGPDEYLDYLDLQALTADELTAWKAELRHFMKSLSIVNDRRFVFKSPTHTARVAVLAEMFPNAKFLHIVRDPLSVFPSTINLWQVLDEAQGMQVPHHRRLKEYVLLAFDRMYAAFEQQRHALAPNRLHEVRYEDLVEDPVGALKQAYGTLELGDFDNIEAPLKEMTQRKRSYRTNEYTLPQDLQQEVMTRWGEFANRYGYPPHAE